MNKERRNKQRNKVDPSFPLEFELVVRVLPQHHCETSFVVVVLLGPGLTAYSQNRDGL